MPDFVGLPANTTPALTDLIAVQDPAGGASSTAKSTLGEAFLHVILVNGTQPLTANWDAGDFQITAGSFSSDGIVLVGSAAPTGTATKVIACGDNAGEPTPASNTACFYARDVSGVVTPCVVDEAGFETVLGSTIQAGNLELSGSTGLVLKAGTGGTAQFILAADAAVPNVDSFDFQMDPNYVYVWNRRATPIVFGVNAATRAAFSTAGISIGTITFPTGTIGGVLTLCDNAGNPTMGANTAGVFAKDVSGTVEVFVIDEGGTATQISEHASDAPGWLYDHADGMRDRVAREEDNGKIRWTNRTRMERLLERLLTGEPIPTSLEKLTFTYIESIDEYNRRISTGQSDG